MVDHYAIWFVAIGMSLIGSSRAVLNRGNVSLFEYLFCAFLLSVYNEEGRERLILHSITSSVAACSLIIPTLKLNPSQGEI